MSKRSIQTYGCPLWVEVQEKINEAGKSSTGSIFFTWKIMSFKV